SASSRRSTARRAKGSTRGTHPRRCRSRRRGCRSSLPEAHSSRPFGSDEGAGRGRSLQVPRRPPEVAAFVFSESDPRARLKRMQVETPAATKTFSDRVAEAVEHKRSQLVVGLDPRLALLPVELRGDAHAARSAAADAVARFCCGIVDAIAPYAVAVKPQLAF